MYTKIKWFLVAASSLIIVGAILGSRGFQNEVTAENSNTFNNINAPLVQHEQIKEDELKQSARKEVDSRTGG